MSTCFFPDGHGPLAALRLDAYDTNASALLLPSLGARFSMPLLARYYTGAAGRRGVIEWARACFVQLRRSSLPQPQCPHALPYLTPSRYDAEVGRILERSVLKALAKDPLVIHDHNHSPPITTNHNH